MSDPPTQTQTFPDQIMLEILTRLPAKSAARFTLVSKRFNNLISHPHFLRTYISRANKTWFILDRLPRVTGPAHPTRFELNTPPRVSSLSVTAPFIDLTLTIPHSKPTAVIISASNGLVLFSCVRKRDPHKERAKNSCFISSVVTQQDKLFVINPVTNEWAGLPYPEEPISRTSVGFWTRVDEFTGLVDRYLAIEYQPIVGSAMALVPCYSSETGKWEKMKGNFMLNRHMWRSDGAFEFDGTLFWIDLSIGLIFLKDDLDLLGTGKKQDKQLQFGFIKLPKGCECAYHTEGLEKARIIDVGGGGGAEPGWIQFLQVGTKVVKLWRLNDYKCWEWSLAYKVSFEAEFEGLVPEPMLFHPFNAEVVFCFLDGCVLFVNVRTKEVQRCGNYSNSAKYVFMLPAVIPSWPSPLPKMSAEGAKERGNEYFKLKKYEKALHWYTTSISRSPTAVAYANRAAANLRLNNFLEAEKDSTDCLGLDANFMKAYWRRVVARKQLGKLGEALEDAEQVLKIDPNHAETMKLVGEIKSLLEQGTPVEDVDGSIGSSM